MKTSVSVSFLIAFLFFELLSIATINFSFCNGSTFNVGCIETERKALLMFKQDLNDTSNRLDSWNIGADGDCCKWAGVVCDNITGYVLELHLGNPRTDPYLTYDGSESTNEVEAEYEAYERSRLGGKLNPSLLDLKHLNYLDLSFNDFRGIWIPRFLGSMESLTYLNLSYAGFLGPIPSSLGELWSLKSLDVSSNRLNGTLSEIHFKNFTKLLYFDASENSLSVTVGPKWTPPFQLNELRLRSCHLGPRFPSWLHSQKFLTNIDISNSGILDSIPSKFWKSLSHFVTLNISHNQIHGEIPYLPIGIQFDSLDLSSNNLTGQLPLIYPRYRFDLSNNKFSGSISHFVCHRMHELKVTEFLKLRGNFLSEELLDCWNIWPFLRVSDLGNNKFTGNLPISMGTLSELRSLRLRKNNLRGTIIPASLGNCTELETLDVGENELVGTIPIWIGERLSSMLILNLRSNKFHGFLPWELCNLASLQILDVAHNNLSGSIPRCISSTSAMVTMDSSNGQNSVQYLINSSNGIVTATEDALLENSIMWGHIWKY